MVLTFGKLLAAAVVLAYFVAALILERPQVGPAVLVLIASALPLALIWFPEMGSSWPRRKTVLFTYEDAVPGRPLRDSHPGLVACMGWFFLLGLPLVCWWLRRP